MTSKAKTLLIHTLLLASTALISACAGLPVPTGAVAGTTAAQQLQGGVWQVQTINGVAIKANAPTMSFGNNLDVTGNASCNNYVSGYAATSTAVIIKQGMATKMACLDGNAMTQEDQFLAHLSNTHLWSIDSAGKLTLTSNKGIITAIRK